MIAKVFGLTAWNGSMAKLPWNIERKGATKAVRLTLKVSGARLLV